MELFDCHLHLQDDKFAGRLAGVMARAAAAGVVRFFSNGTREEDWPRLLALAREHPGVTPFFGLHPWFLSARSPGWLDSLRAHLDSIPAGIGEIGLDRACRAPLGEQLAVFEAQFALARARQLPVTLHCVRAWGKLLQALAVDGPHPPGIILHGYGGPLEMVDKFLSLGAYFSFSFAGEGPASPALLRVPGERLLLESDAPARRAEGEGGINEPARMEFLYARAARLRGVTPAELASLVAANGQRLRANLER